MAIIRFSSKRETKMAKRIIEGVNAYLQDPDSNKILDAAIKEIEGMTTNTGEAFAPRTDEMIRDCFVSGFFAGMEYVHECAAERLTELGVDLEQE